MQALLFNKKFILFIALLPFFYMTYCFISLDFWNDEVYSLKYFTFVPLSKTVTDYHVPNNHIFFNLLNNIYLKITGNHDIHELMNYPYILRLVPFIYSLGTLFYLYITAKKFFNTITSLLSVIILLTSLPFFNYFLQLRGYSLSMFFLMMMIYHSWNLENNFTIKDFILLALASCLSVYTIPLNIYYVFSIFIFYFILLLNYRLKSFDKKNKQKKDAHSPRNVIFVLAALSCGVCCSLLLYTPVFHEVFYNEYVTSHGWFNGSFSLPGIVFNAFLSKRYVLYALFFAGIIFYFIHRDKHHFIFFQRLIFLMNLLLLPFIISFVRADEAPDRAFVILVPVYSLCIASGIYFFTASVPGLWNKRYVMLLLMACYCNISFAFYYSKNKRHLKDDIAVSNRSQDIKYNYYLACFHPDLLVKTFQKIYKSKPANVVILESDYYGIREYLDKYEIKYTDSAYFDSLLEHEIFLYVLTIKPNGFSKWMKETHPDVKFYQLNSIIDFHNFYYCTRVKE